MLGLGLRLVKIQRKHGIDAHLYVPHDSAVPEYSRMSWQGQKKASWVHYWGLNGAFGVPERLLFMKKFDIIQPYAMGNTYCWLSKKKIVSYPMGSDLREDAQKNNPTGWLLRKGFTSADRLVISGPFFKNSIQKYGLKNKCVYIPQPVDLRTKPRYSFSSKELLFFHPGRLALGERGTKNLLEGLGLFLEKHPKTKVRIEFVDHGVDSKKVKKMIRRLGIDRFCSFVKPMKLKELTGKMSKSDLILENTNPKWGTYGLAALEAMALGRPVLTYLDLSETGYPQWLGSDIPPVISEFKPERICERLDEFVSSSVAEKKILAKATRAWVERWHSPDRIAEKYVQIYNKVLSP